MQTWQEPIPQPLPRRTYLLTRIGAILGLKLGFGLSVVYTLLVVVTFSFLSSGLSGLAASFLMLVFGLPYIVVLGILPASTYGIGTGLILGKLMQSLYSHCSRSTFILISVVTCLTIATLSHLMLKVSPDLSLTRSIILGNDPGDGLSYGLLPFSSYPVWLGFPTLVYLLAGAWAGHYLYAVAEHLAAGDS